MWPVLRVPYFWVIQAPLHLRPDRPYAPNVDTTDACLGKLPVNAATSADITAVIPSTKPYQFITTACGENTKMAAKLTRQDTCNGLSQTSSCFAIFPRIIS